MANKSIFNRHAARKTQAAKPSSPRAADTTNAAGGVAYKLSDKQALAQMAATGCFNRTFHVSAEEQLETITQLAMSLPAEFVAKVAVYARDKGYMKDAPAYLVAALAKRREHDLLRKVFPRVIDNGKMLRNIAQMVRGGTLGEGRSFGRSLKTLIEKWINDSSPKRLVNATVGNSPSMADIIRMVHPKPANAERRALYGWALGKEVNKADLPQIVRDLLAWNEAKGELPAAPDVEFRLLTGEQLSDAAWAGIARNMSWNQLRMNLNTLARHNVFKDRSLAELLAERLGSPEEVRKAKVFPYAIMTAWLCADEGVPAVVKNALRDAVELSISNVPRLEQKIAVCIDVSGSMSFSITGHRKGATSAVRCVDVAALIGAVMLRNCPHTTVLPFDTSVHQVHLKRETNVVDIAARLAISGGGTACSVPLAELNKRGAKVDLVLMVSDNESWADSAMAARPEAYTSWLNGRGSTGHFSHGSPTAFAQEWFTLKQRCPNAKLVCIDLTPNTSAQAPTALDVLNVGGFSDAVFDVVSSFLEAPSDDHWVEVIEKINLDTPA